VVLLTMIPSRPLADHGLDDGLDLAVLQVGGDLQEDRIVAGRAAFSRPRASAIRPSNSSSAALVCRARRPGVLGEEMLTVK
jgi:hypothetical protein